MIDVNGQIGVAVQGAGTVSTEHLRAYLKNPHCRVVAIGSRTKEGAANKARQLGLDPGEIGIYDQIDDLLAHPGLDALSICTPHARHAEETIAAARAGKHVLIEKPVATNLADLRSMDAGAGGGGGWSRVCRSVAMGSRRRRGWCQDGSRLRASLEPAVPGGEGNAGRGIV